MSTIKPPIAPRFDQPPQLRHRLSEAQPLRPRFNPHNSMASIPGPSPVLRPPRLLHTPRDCNVQPLKKTQSQQFRLQPLEPLMNGLDIFANNSESVSSDPNRLAVPIDDRLSEAKANLGTILEALGKHPQLKDDYLRISDALEKLEIKEAEHQHRSASAQMDLYF